MKASAPFTYTSTSTSSTITISARLSSYAEIDLAGIKIDREAMQPNAGVYIANASHIRIYDGEVTNPQDGPCILDHASQYVTWWGFNAHNCGGSGFLALTATGPVQNDDFQGTVSYPGQYIADDPHQEKGTGYHCFGEFADAGSGYAFTNNRLALDCNHDPVGAAFAFGDSADADLGLGAAGETNTLYLRAQNTTCVATLQTCGNGIELWGHTNQMGLDVKYAEFDNLTGYPLFANAVSSGNTLNGVTVEYGRATNVMTNTYPKGLQMWDKTRGEVYQDVQPAP